jgi:hypothetical protein
MRIGRVKGRGVRHRVCPSVESMEGRVLLSQGGVRAMRIQGRPAALVRSSRLADGEVTLGPGAKVEGSPAKGLLDRGREGIPSPNAGRATFVRGPLVVVSSAEPLAGPSVDNVAGQSGRVFLGSAVEPQLAVDPRNPNHLIAVWQQDRWSTPGARGIVAGISVDGGKTWTRVTIPGITRASGGPYFRASDPWVTFSHTGQIAYVSSLPFNDVPQGGQSAVAVSTSFHNGGRAWNAPVTLEALPNPSLQTDKESITADPVRPRYAYAAWNQQAFSSIPFTATTAFSRTTDGGRTWEPPSIIYRPGPNAVATNHQLFARPDGTLINVFTVFRVASFQTLEFHSTLTVLRSPNRGETWGDPMPGPELLGSPVLDPDNPGIPVRTPSTPSGIPAQWADVAMDRRTGTLYAVWQDARFSLGQPYPFDRIAFARSIDGGATWSQPIPIDQTPANLSPLNRQAFLPAIQVAADGTIGVSYYDFRNNTTSDNGVRTDAWIVCCRPGTDCTNPASWRNNEVRLTDTSFDLQRAPLTTGGLTGGGYFLGDYTGLKAVGRDFLALFVVTKDDGPATVVFRRVGPARARGPLA